MQKNAAGSRGFGPLWCLPSGILQTEVEVDRLTRRVELTF